MQPAAYNSRIPYMLTPSPSRLSSLLFILALLIAAPANAQNWAGAEEQLAGKIVAATGAKTVALEVLNRSSLSAATADDIRRNLLTQLAVLGAHFVAPEQAAATVRVSLSEDLQSYVWIAEIRQGANSPSIVMVSLPRSSPLSVEPEAAAVVIRRIPLWSQLERILDVAVIDGNPARMLVLDGNGVSSYRLQDNRWQAEQAFPIAHSRPWPRDLRGRLVRGKDNLFDAYLPGVHCRSSAGTSPSMTCYDSDDSWPIGTDSSNLNASFTSYPQFLQRRTIAGSRKTNDGAGVLFRSRRASWTNSFVASGHRGWTGASARRQHRSSAGKAGLG